MGVQSLIFPAHIQLISFIVLVACSVSVNAVNLKECGKRVQAAQQGSWNATNSTSPPPPFHLSYKECLAECGSGPGDISWIGSSQTFGAWFLPWIALAFQIPFGGESPLDDIFNFFMTVGSPALAAYSLQITHLNACWLTDALLDLEYPNSEAISTVISALQHVPIQISHIDAVFPSLIVLPQNDAYWEYLLKGVKKIRRWSIPLLTGFVWVFLATLLTIIDSFYYPPLDDLGYSTVAVWTYLLPLIIGWLYVGSQPEPNHLQECVHSANQIAWVATGRKDMPVRSNDVFGRPGQAIEFIKKNDVASARKDELKTVPVFNYSRAFIWSLHAQHILSLVRNAAMKAELRIPVDNEPGRDAEWVSSGGFGMAKENRLGSREQVVRYCTETFTPLEEAPETSSPTISSSQISGYAQSTPPTVLPFYNHRNEITEQSRWAPGIWGRVTLAVLFALGLQWGTVGAAILIHYFKPPVGMGCRTLSFLVYGITATVSMAFCLAASILAHMSRPHHGSGYRVSRYRQFLNGGALVCGYLGKILAFAAGVGIITICFFQSSGVYDNCYCTSMIFGKGAHDVVILAVANVVGPKTVRVWIGGLIMAFSAAGVYGFSLYFMTPSRR